MNRRHLLLFAGALVAAGLILDAGVPTGHNRNRTVSPGPVRAAAVKSAAPTLASAVAPSPRVMQLPEVCYAPGTSMEVIERNAQRRGDLISSLQSQGFQFPDGNRWSTTATNGGGLTQGQVTTITWNIVPDGTPIGALNGEPAAPSNLKAFLNGIYGNEAVWIAHFQTVFDRWGALTGITYVRELNDDGVDLASAAGLLGTRADVRIGGHFIDGPFNVLGYNFFPNNGDMVLDTADTFYNNTANDSQGLINVLAHEHGHGLGMPHTCPINQTKLMEPSVSFAFVHAQEDDILAGWRGYGDDKEDNETSGTAFNLGGPLSNGVTTVTEVSADDNSDIDFYKFTVAAGKFAKVTMTPVGTSYLQGPQSTCSTGTTFNALIVNDLGVDLLGTNGTTVLATANTGGPGVADTIAPTSLGGAGTYFVRVFAGGVNNVQGYRLEVTISDQPVNASINDVSQSEGNAGVANATFTVSLNAPAISTVSLNYATADGTATGSTQAQSNAGAISISSGATNASPYPSNIVFSGVGGTIAKATVSLNSFSHSWPRDVDVLLVGPGGQKIVLMSDVGGFGGVGGTPASNVTLTLDATAGASLPASTLTTGTFQPTNLSDGEGGDTWGTPAPIAPYTGSLNDLVGASPNGTWSLYVTDDSTGDSGSIASGWTVNLTITGGDYTPTSGTLTFTVGQSSKQVMVSINGDTTVEPSETFTVGLSSPSPGLVITDATGLGTIVNDEGAPIIVPQAASLITASTATLNSTVNPNGQATSAVYQYGLTTGYGSTTGSTNLGSGLVPVAFNTPVAGLACNTLYHFRASASNGGGTTDGGDLTFTTSACAPLVASSAASNVATTTADLSGNVTSDGGGAITERGFVYSVFGTNPNPTIGGGGVTKVPVAGTTGAFAINVSPLTASTNYAFKAFATNSAGTTYSSVLTFTTSDPAPAEALVARTLALNSTARSTLSNATTQIWYRARLSANRSYQISAWPVDHEQGVDAVKLSVALFSDNAGTVQANGVAGVSTVLEAAPNQGGDDKPFTATIRPTSSGVYKIRVSRVSGGATPHTVNLMIRETTLFSPWTSRAAGFEGFIEMHNNTNAAISVTLRGFDSAGVQQGAGLTLTIQPNATDFRTANQVGVPLNIFAGIVLTHDGVIGAVSANITTLNGANGLSFDSAFTTRSNDLLGKPIR